MHETRRFGTPYPLALVQTFDGPKTVEVRRAVYWKGRAHKILGEGFKYKICEEPFEFLNDDPRTGDVWRDDEITNQ